MRTRRSLALLTAVLAAPILSLTFPASAQAATYDGQDPIASGCASTAITAKSANIYAGSLKIGRVDLRYSTACRTVWARVITYQIPSGQAWVNRGAPLHGTQTCFVEMGWSSAVGGYTCHTRMLNDSGTTSTAKGEADSPEDLSSHYATTGAY